MKISLEQATVDFVVLESLNMSTLVISGGEPTLHPQLRKIVEAAKKHFKVSVISNGTNPEVLKDIALNGQVSVWMSIDYYGEKQDVYRGFKGLWRNYQQLAGITNVRSTLLNDNLEDIILIAQDVANYGLEMTIVPCRGTKVELTPTPQMMANLVLWLIEQQNVNVNYTKITVDDPSVRQFFATKLPQLAPKHTQCEACNTVIRVTPDRHITPCPFIPTVIGSLDDLDLRKKIYRMKQQLLSTYNGKCASCQYRGQCGGCRASTNQHCFLSI